MAMHTATDVFAHSVYGKDENGYWNRFFHDEKYGNKYADDPTKCPWRFHVAERVVQKILAKNFASNGAGTYSQFLDCDYDSGQFKLYNFAFYLSDHSKDPNIYSLYSQYSRSW